MSTVNRFRGRFPSPSDRQALQDVASRSLLEGPQEPNSVRSVTFSASHLLAALPLAELREATTGLDCKPRSHWALRDFSPAPEIAAAHGLMKRLAVGAKGGKHVFSGSRL